MSVSVCLSPYVPFYPSTYTSVCPSVRLFAQSNVHLPVRLSAWLYGIHTFLRSLQFFNISISCQHFIETDDLLSCSLKLIVPILEYINRVQALQVYFIFNLILPSMPTSSKCSLSFRFPHHNTVRISASLHSYYKSSPFHSSRFDQADIDWTNNFVFLLVIQVF